jgi:uncharacterized membrane protein YkvA (DUF1232 family)
MEIANYVSDGGALVTPEQAESFRQRLPALRIKAAGINAEELPHLSAQVEFLAQVVEDVLDGRWHKLPFRALGEAIFALNYVLKGSDIIPDVVPALGFTDDSSVVRAVLTRFESDFRAFADARGIAWRSVSARP